MTDDLDASQTARRRMIAEQIEARGIHDPRVLAAIESIPRERFVPSEAQPLAYADQALPIAERQTISQPFMVAYMTQALDVEPQSKVLEVGTGSGYQAAVLSKLTNDLHSVERIAALSEAAGRRLADLGIQHVHLYVADGSLGLPEHAPFDRIIVTAASPEVPRPLVDQLAVGGKLIIPVGPTDKQTLVSVAKRSDRTIERPLIECRFVKLLGQAGWT